MILTIPYSEGHNIYIKYIKARALQRLCVTIYTCVYLQSTSPCFRPTLLVLLGYLPVSETQCVRAYIHYTHAVDNVIDFISPGDTRTFVVRDDSIIHRIWRVISTHAQVMLNVTTVPLGSFDFRDFPAQDTAVIALVII